MSDVVRQVVKLFSTTFVDLKLYTMTSRRLHLGVFYMVCLVVAIVFLFHPNLYTGMRLLDAQPPPVDQLSLTEAQKAPMPLGPTALADAQNGSSPGSTARPPPAQPAAQTSTTPRSTTTAVPIGPRGIEHRPPDPLPCGWTAESLAAPAKRRQAYLQCSSSEPPTIAFREVPSNVTPSLWSVGHDDKACLKWFIRDHCLDRVEGQKIPRVVHLVRFGPFEFRLDAFIALISVARIMKPCIILLHSDVIPHGPLWQAMLQLVPQVLHVPAERPRQIYNRTIDGVEHSADVTRIKILLEYGGVYIDMDYFFVNPLDDLYNQSAVMGFEMDVYLCNGIIVAEANSRFLTKWLLNYTDFNDKSWSEHSGHRSFLIAREHPKDILVVRNFHKPDSMKIRQFFDRSTTPKDFDFRKIYGLHLFTRVVQGRVFTSTRIDQQDNAVGDVVRYVLYGDEHACMKKSVR